MHRWIKITLTFLGIAAPALMLFQNFTYVKVAPSRLTLANPCSQEDAAFAVLTEEDLSVNTPLRPFSTLESAIVGQPSVARTGTRLRVAHPDATLWVNGENRGQVTQVHSGDAVQIEMRTSEVSRVGRCSLGFATLNGHVVVWRQNSDTDRSPAHD